MTRYTNCSVSQFVCRNSGNGMSWSNKLEMLLKNFNLRSKIGPDEGDCKAFFVGEEQVGVIRADIWKHLLHYPSVFQYDKSRERVTLNPEWRTYDERSEKFDNVLRELRTKEIFSTLAGWRDEVYLGLKDVVFMLMAMLEILMEVNVYGYRNGHTQSQRGLESWTIWACGPESLKMLCSCTFLLNIFWIKESVVALLWV